MLFNSLQFVVFLVVVYGLYLALDRRGQNLMLLVASYVFYGSWDWRFLSLLLFSTGIDYLAGRWIYATAEPSRRKLFLMMSMVSNLGLLGFFKYFNFFAGGLRDLLGHFGLAMTPFTLNVILPVGISFYTFQTMSYTIDVYRGSLKAEKDFLDFALFVSFFPQLVAGPIERASNLLHQFAARRIITRKDISEGLWLIFWGYFLKVYVADNLAEVAEQVFAARGIINGAEALMGTYAFNFQVLGDFAGYSSIAIGVSRLMGIRLMINFLFPYFVTNPREFWANWHISLSTWLRDYLYFPLGGNRKGEVRKYFNLFITMMLGGLWHGAAWTFVVWGFFHSAILIVHRLLEPLTAHVRLKGVAGGLWLAVRIVFMFQVICLGGLIFRCQSVGQIGDMLESILFHFGPWTHAAVYYGLQVLTCAGPVLLVHFFQMRSKDVVSVNALPQAVRVPLLVALFYLLVVWGEYGAREFIYFQF